MTEEPPRRGLAKLTTIEAEVLFLRDPVWLLVAMAVPIRILLVFGLPGFAREPAAELGGQRPIDTVLPSVAMATNVGVLAISALPIYLAAYREKGILRRLSTTPASPAMPDLLSRIGDLTPLGAFREAVQDARVGMSPSALHLVALAAVAVISGAAAAKLFRWE